MKKYFLHINNSTVGPYSWHELRAMNIAPTTPVWYDGLGNWRNANTVAELQSLFNSNPQGSSSQPNAYVPPKKSSTSFTQINYSENQPAANNTGAKVGLIVGLVVALLVGGGIFFFYNLTQKRKKLDAEIAVIIDSMNIAESMQREENIMNDSINQDAVVDPTAESSSLLSEYAGSFTNYSGGTILIQDNGSDFQIKLKLRPSAGTNCTKDISGTGSITATDEITMKTDEGCKIKLTFSGKDIVSIEENPGCDSFHGSHCTFVALYIRE